MCYLQILILYRLSKNFVSMGPSTSSVYTCKIFSEDVGSTIALINSTSWMLVLMYFIMLARNNSNLSGRRLLHYPRGGFLHEASSQRDLSLTN